MTVHRPDDPGRLVELRVVLGQAAGEVGRLVRQEAAAVLPQVERVEVPAPLGEEVGQVGLEEVVVEAVHVEHRAPGRPVGATPDQRGDDRPLVVATEVDRVALIGLAQDVDLHPTRLPIAGP
jgi:hypothetical protein